MVRFNSAVRDSDRSPSFDLFDQSSTSGVRYAPLSSSGSGGGDRAAETPEQEAERRPFAGVGKTSISLFGRSPIPPLEQEQRPDLPTFDPNLVKQTHEDSPLDTIGRWVRTLGDATAILTPGGTMTRDMRKRMELEKALAGDDPLLKSLASQWQAKAESNEVDAFHAVSGFYDQYLQIEARRRGDSAYLEQAMAQGVSLTNEKGEIDPLGAVGGMFGEVMKPLSVGSQAVQRTLSGEIKIGDWTVHTDRISETLAEYDLPNHGRLAGQPGLVEVTDQYKRGVITDDEYRDLLLIEGFGLTNPDPLGTGTPLHTVGNAIVSIGLEVVTDPLTLVTGVGGAVRSIGGSAAKSTIDTILRTAVREGSEELARTVADDAVKAAVRQGVKDGVETAVQSAARDVITKEITQKITEEALRVTGGTAKSLRPADLMEAAKRLSVDDEVIRRGIDAAGWKGSLAANHVQVVRAATAIDDALNPLTWVGKTAGAAKARVFMSRMAAEGYYNAFGWLNVWKTDNVMRSVGISDEVLGTLDGRAAANHALQVGRDTEMRIMRASADFIDPAVVGNASARRAAEMQGPNMTALMERQVSRTAEYIVPGPKQSFKEATKVWHDEVSQMLVEMGATGDVAAAVAKLGEQEMSLIRNRYWAFVGGELSDAVEKSMPTAKFDASMVERVTMLGAAQMTEQVRRDLLAAIARGDVKVIRSAAERYDDLRVNLHGSADDDELMKLASAILTDLKGKVPTAIAKKDKSILPKELQAWLNRFGGQGYQIALRPEEVVGLLRNADGEVIGARRWIDFEKTAPSAARVGRVQAGFVDMTRGISGAAIELQAKRRFVQHLAITAGASEADGLEVFRQIKRMADDSGLAPRGLSVTQMHKAVENAKGLTPAVRNDARRAIVDGVLDAYRNETRLVGVTQAFTGEMKKLLGSWGNWLGYLSENFYPNVRFAKNPIFQLQELTEYPFFLALRGQFPMRAALGSMPVLNRVGPLADQAAAKSVFDEKTRFVMEYMKSNGDYVASDMIEQSQHVLRGGKAGERIALRTSRLAQAFEGGVQKFDRVTDANTKKVAAEAVAYRNKLGAELRDAMMEESPMTWAAVRSYYPPSFSDGEVAASWLFDLIGRTDPQSVWNTMSPEMFVPAHLGKRASLSSHLISYALTGNEQAPMSWHMMRKRIASPKDGLSFDQVENSLRTLGADEDYIERTRWALTGPTTDEFYDKMVQHGVSKEQAAALRQSDEIAARRLHISLPEYLGRRWAEAPQSVDQFGNRVGNSHFQAIVDSLERRGLTAPERGSDLLQALTEQGDTMVPDWEKFLPVPEGMKVKDLPADVRAARSKAVGWQGARDKRSADPTLGTPPRTADGKPVYRSEKHTFGRPTPDEWVAQLEAVIPDEAARREYADWYTDMQRGFLALFSDTPEKQVQEAAKMIVAFGVTQLNTSPANGMEFLYRVLSMAQRGEDWPSVLGLSPAEGKRILQGAGGLNFGQLESILMNRGTAIPEGLGQKLADFIDSLIGKRERSVGIHGPDPANPWGPVAGDVWAKRDLGFLDPKVGGEVWRVVDGGASSKVIGDIKKGPDGKPVLDADGDPVYAKVDRIEVYDAEGKVIQTFGSDVIGDSVPTNLEYDFIVEFYNDIARYLNTRDGGYLGKTDWTGADAQAVGWFRAKRAFGDATGDVRSALFKGRWTVGSEVSPVAGTRYADMLPPSEQVAPEVMSEINDEMSYHVVRQAMADAGTLSPRPRGATSGAIVGADGTVVSAPHIEVLGERSAAMQTAARLGLYGQMDEVVLIRDTMIKSPDYANAKGKGNIGIAVRVPVASEEEARRLLQGISTDAPSFPKGAHVAQTDDGSWMVQALWNPESGPATTLAFKKAVPEAELNQWLTQYLGREVTHERGLVEFVRATNDWSANPDGRGYHDVIERPSLDIRGRPSTPSASAGELERASVRDLTERFEGIIQSRLPREAASDRTARLYASLPADGGTGRVRTADDILAGSPDVQYQRAPAGTRGAIVRAADGRHSLYFGGRSGSARVRPDTLLHELAHSFANDLDQSAVRRIKGIKQGFEGTPPGRGRNAHRLTQDDHEWFVDQFLLWAKDPNSVHTTLRPLMAQFREDISGSMAHDVGARARVPLDRAVDEANAAVLAARQRGASQAEMKPLLATQRAARKARKDALATGGNLSPEMRAFFDEMAEAAKRPEPKAMWDEDERLMFEMSQMAHLRATNDAKALIHFRPNRSWLERSLNHPFFGMYPLSYMYGKVLPELVEFLMFRPFGFKAPGVAASVTNRMYQSFMNQQESDPELRQFLHENEPALRTLSMFVPGVPWDLPVNAPLWMRRIIEANMTRDLKRQELLGEGYTPEEAEAELPEIDYGKIITDVVSYQVGPARTPTAVTDIWEGVQALPTVAGRVLGGDAGEMPEAPGTNVDSGPFRPEPPAPAPTATPEADITVGPATIPAAQITADIEAQMDALELTLSNPYNP